MVNTVYILGAGAIGTLWASKLYQAGVPVALILRAERAKDLRNKKLKLTLQSDQYTQEMVIPAYSPANVPQIDYLVVTTKANHALEALKSIEHKLHPKAELVLLQNGMGVQDEVAEHFPGQTLWAGTSTDGAWLHRFGHVEHAGQGTTRIGCWSNATGLHSELLPLLQKTPLKVEIVDNIAPYLWQKLAINSAINGLTALYNCNNGDLMNPDIWPEVQALCDETTALLSALGITLPEPLLPVVEYVIGNTASNISSTCQDCRLGRATELRFINGYILKRAQDAGISLPSHQGLMRALKVKGFISPDELLG